jgi:hypothetical protein
MSFNFNYSIYIISTILLAFVIFNIISKKNVEKFLEFIHIPKNAGTTIENIANEKGVKWGRFKPALKKRMNINNCTYWHLPPKHFDQDGLYNQDETFCVIRDPFERVVSEYKYRVNNKKNMDDPIKMNEWISTNVDPYNIYNLKLNCHILPQTEYIYDDHGNKTCDNVLSFNNLTSEFNDLMKDNNLDIIMDTERRDNSTNKMKVSVNDLNESNIKLIKRLYKTDFEELKRIKNTEKSIPLKP